MRAFIAGLTLLALGMAAPRPAERALVIDYELTPADFSDELIRRIEAAGLSVNYQPDNPTISKADLARHRMLVLLASAGAIGSGLQLPAAGIGPIVQFVRQGGLLVLGVPSDPEAYDQLPVYNRLLEELRSGIQVLPAIVDDDTDRFAGVMFPGCYFRPGRLVLDRATILQTERPAEARAHSTPGAYAILGLGRERVSGLSIPKEGFPVVATSQAGRGRVLVTGRFNLNIGGYNGRVGVQPIGTLDWLSESDRFIQGLLSEMTGQATPARAVTPARPTALASARAGVFGEYMKHGIRGAWGDMDRDDAWLQRFASESKAAGLNYIWGIGWPERLISRENSAAEQERLRHRWETFASSLDNSPVGWTIGMNYPGAGVDLTRYEACRGADGRPMRLLSPLDQRFWQERMIPAFEEVARFSLRHPSVKGMTIDYEMYGYEPIIFYPETVGFEDAAFHAVSAKLPKPARNLAPEQRYEWLRRHNLLGRYFELLEKQAEELGRSIRTRIHAINPKFIFGAYQAGLPYTWFYRGLMRGMSTPEMPMIWLSFSTQSAAETERWRKRQQYILNASAVMLGTHPLAQWKTVIPALTRYQNGYWLNRFNWLIDDAGGRRSIEIPDGTSEQAWRALTEANRSLP